jgi:hypothetical protein
LFKDNNFKTTAYSFPNEYAANYFQIINVGNDNAVLTRILNREQYLWNSGFQRIIALRDMYSKSYREVAENATIQNGINKQFQEGIQKTLKNRAKRPENIHFHFAIMETEAWIIGLKECFTRIDERLNDEFILQKLNIDLSKDPETTYFHPASTLDAIFMLVDKKYNKSADEVNAIVGHIFKQDFIKLFQSDKCASFRAIHSILIPN